MSGNNYERQRSAREHYDPSREGSSRHCHPMIDEALRLAADSVRMVPQYVDRARTDVDHSDVDPAPMDIDPDRNARCGRMGWSGRRDNCGATDRTCNRRPPPTADRDETTGQAKKLRTNPRPRR